MTLHNIQSVHLNALCEGLTNNFLFTKNHA